MADTARTRSALLSLLSDNSSGAISPQDFRDVLVSILPAEHLYADNFYFTQPTPDNITTDATERGWKLYSQTVGYYLSLVHGQVVALTNSNTWSTADASTVAHKTVLGWVCSNTVSRYTSNDTSLVLLRKGIAYYSAIAATLSAGGIGTALFLLGTASACSISYTDTATNSRIVGYIMPAGVGSVQCKGKIWLDFDAGWGMLEPN